MRLIKKTSTSGFTLFFAVLVASLALSVGLAIYNLTAREIDISSVSVQSQYAIYSADTGAECALYWDSKYNCQTDSITGVTTCGSIFPTSTQSVGNVPAPGSNANVFCESQDITAAGASGIQYQPNPTATAATTTFTLNFGSQPYCAKVWVVKYLLGNIPQTTVHSYGYNTCNPNSQERVERLLDVTY